MLWSNRGIDDFQCAELRATLLRNMLAPIWSAKHCRRGQISTHALESIDVSISMSDGKIRLVVRTSSRLANATDEGCLMVEPVLESVWIVRSRIAAPWTWRRGIHGVLAPDFGGSELASEIRGPRPKRGLPCVGVRHARHPASKGRRGARRCSASYRWDGALVAERCQDVAQDRGRRKE